RRGGTDPARQVRVAGECGAQQHRVAVDGFAAERAAGCAQDLGGFAVADGQSRVGQGGGGDDALAVPCAGGITGDDLVADVHQGRAAGGVIDREAVVCADVERAGDAQSGAVDL